MGNLAKIENKPITATKTELSILSVYKTNKVAQIKPNDATDKISDAITYCISISGQGKDLKPQELVILTNQLYDLLIKKFRFLSVDELEIAFYNGAIGEYGDYFGINLKTFKTWLSAYIDERQRALKKEKQEVYEKPEPTEAEKKAIRLDFFNECLFSKLPDIKKNKWNVKSENHLWVTIEGMGIVALTKEEKQAVAERTVDRLKRKYLKDADSLYKQKENNTKLNNLINKTFDKENFKSECRITAFQEWVVNSIATGVDIEKLITDKIK